jgi:transposase
MRHDLTDEEWQALEPLGPARWRLARVDDRRIVAAIFHVLRAGISGHDLPKKYGPYTTASNRFNPWSIRGVRQCMFECHAAHSRDPLAMIESTAEKAHRAAGGTKERAKQGIGISRGGRTTKIHAAVDGRRLPLRLVITGGNVNDSASAEAVP